MRRLLAIGLLIVGTVSPRVGGTSAYLTSVATSSSLSFASATIKLDALESVGGSSKGQMLMNLSSAYPGITLYDPVVIENTNTAGNADLLFGVTSQLQTGSGTLASNIQLTVFDVPATADCSSTGFGTYGSANLRYGTAGSPPTGNALSAAAVGSAINIIGNLNAGVPNHAGMISLTPGSRTILCFKVDVPTTFSPFTYYSPSTPVQASVQFLFTAVQKSGIA